jgi:hypothetical protein
MNSIPDWVGSDADTARAQETTAAKRPRGELERLLAGDLPQDFVREVRRSLADPLFRRREGLTTAEAGALAYTRARFLARELRFCAADVARDPRRLYALHEWVGLADGATCTILGIHYCLALGSIVAQGEGRAELDGFIAELLRFRERCLRQELTTDASTRPGADPFVAWNEKVNPVMAAAEAHGDCIVAACFVTALEEARDDDARDALATLCALWALGRIERHAGWFLAEGCLTDRTVKELGRVRDRLCADIEPYASTLVDAFDLDNALLQAPIAETDYVRAYSTPPPSTA